MELKNHTGTWRDTNPEPIDYKSNALTSTRNHGKQLKILSYNVLYRDFELNPYEPILKNRRVLHYKVLIVYFLFNNKMNFN